MRSRPTATKQYPYVIKTRNIQSSIMKATIAEKSGSLCPRCGDTLARDLIGRGFVRHESNRTCHFGVRGRDPERVPSRKRAGGRRSH